MNIADIIYKSFENGHEEKKVQDKVTFAPSYLSDCKRQIFYKKKGFKPTNPPDLAGLLKMSWGDILHKDIQRILITAGVLESHEIHRTVEYDGLTFNYYYDGIVKLDIRAILEIKTVYASGYKSIENEPKPEHVLQAISYMVFEKIDKAIILYAGRDNGYLKQHKVEIIDNRVYVNTYDTDYMDKWNQKVQDMKLLKVMIESGATPNRDYSIVLKNDGATITTDFQKDTVKYKSDWQCSYCGFKNMCWAKELEQIRNHKFFINNKFI